ncbi:MAG TPA: c-type cytochrome [Burkholderiales bacterium]
MAELAAGIALGLCAGPAALAADGAAVFEQKCIACHGAGGASQDSSIPTIGGYSAKYIVDSISNFKKKLRPCAEVAIPSGPKKGSKSDMCKVIAELTDAEAEAAARYLTGQKFVRAKQPFDAAKAAKGQSVYGKLCRRCHEDNGSSPDEDNGILAGQWTPYLKGQLAAFRGGKRTIDDKMKARLSKVSADEEDALLHFFASQQ